MACVLDRMHGATAGLSRTARPADTWAADQNKDIVSVGLSCLALRAIRWGSLEGCINFRLRCEVDDGVNAVGAQDVQHQIRAGLVSPHQDEVAEQRRLAEIAAHPANR